MQRSLLLCSFCIVSSLLYALPNAWINEVHYDNAGSDSGEFVEVMVEDPEEFSLGDLTLYMYNGHDGCPYCLDCVSEFDAGERIASRQVFTWFQRGIQNDCEGMILVYYDVPVDMIAYEGSFTGTVPPAERLPFTDVGVAESGSSPSNASIYLSGMPGDAWCYGYPSTPGKFNPGQLSGDTETPVRLGYFRAEKAKGYIGLEWQSESESGICRYILQRDDAIISSLDAQGYSTRPVDYAYRDRDIAPGRLYRYVLTCRDLAGNIIRLDSLQIRAEGVLQKEPPFHMALPFPNPFNPRNTIRVDMARPAALELAVYDLAGGSVRTLYEGVPGTGRLNIPVDLCSLPSGFYILHCRSGTYSLSRKLTLLK